MARLDAETVFGLNPQEKRTLIEEQAKKIIIDAQIGISEELHSAYQISSVINTFIQEYFLLMHEKYASILEEDNLKQAIKFEIQNFLPEIIQEMDASIPSDESIENSLKNIYELSGAKRLSFSNMVTRTLSTKMGSLWERIANVSPYAINPELEFGGLKITGIDALVWNRDDGVIEYHQMKTQQNTLTGSQKPRSVSELLIHDHPVFSACFKTKASWTFSRHDKILRLSGEEFWKRIGIDYDLLLQSIKEMIQDLETKYIELLQSDDRWSNSQSELFDGNEN